MKHDMEDRKLAVIDLTCTFPNEYCVSALARWAKMSYNAVKRLVKTLDLDVKKFGNGGHGSQMINIRLNNYLPKRQTNP